MTKEEAINSLESKLAKLFPTDLNLHHDQFYTIAEIVDRYESQGTTVVNGQNHFRTFKGMATFLVETKVREFADDYYESQLSEQLIEDWFEGSITDNPNKAGFNYIFIDCIED